MMQVYLLYQDDAWHSRCSKDLLCVASSLAMCYDVAIENGASEEQVNELRNFRQSQCSGKNFEFNIELWDVL